MTCVGAFGSPGQLNTPKGLLWVGSDKAANNPQMLEHHHIRHKFNMKEDRGGKDCKDSHGIMTEGFNMAHILGNYMSLPVDPSRPVAHWHWSETNKQKTGLNDIIASVDHHLSQGHSVLLYDRLGVREAVVATGAYMMSKTRCNAVVAFEHLRRVRPIIEGHGQSQLRSFQSTGLASDFLDPTKRQAMPCVCKFDELERFLKGIPCLIPAKLSSMKY